MNASIPARVDAEPVATMLLCLMQSLLVVGKVGRSRAALKATVSQAMQLLA